MPTGNASYCLRIRIGGLEEPEQLDKIDNHSGSNAEKPENNKALSVR